MKMTVQELVDMLRDETESGHSWEAAHILHLDERAVEIIGVFNLANVVRKINERRNP